MDIKESMVVEFSRRYGARIDYDPRSWGSRYDYTYGKASDYRKYNKIEIEISVEGFQHLVENDIRAEEEFRANVKEKRIRSEYPAVAEAYDQYRMLLALCK